MSEHMRGLAAQGSPDMRYFYLYIDMKLVRGKPNEEIEVSVDYELAELRRIVLEELGVGSGTAKSDSTSPE